MNRMYTIFYKRIFGVFILIFLCFSCTSNLDFNQASSLKLTPVVVANFASFEILASQFVSGGIERAIPSVESNFDLFKDSFLYNNVTGIDLYFEMNNTINRDYEIELYFLNTTNSKVYTSTFTIPANATASTLYTKNLIIGGSDLTLIKTARKIGFQITMLPGTPLTSSSLGSLKLRSSATVYLTVQ